MATVRTVGMVSVRRKLVNHVRELRAGVIDRNGSNMPKAETPKKRR
jgi:hypothetical protein